MKDPAIAGPSSLTYRDRTGDTAVRHLTAGDVSLRWPDGFTIWIEAADIGPVVAAVEQNYAMKRSRSGAFWARQRRRRVQRPTNPNEQEQAG